MGTELTPTHPRPALGKFGKQAIKHDGAVGPRRGMTLPTRYSPVINNSQHRQPSMQPPRIHFPPPVSPAFVRKPRRSDAYPRFPPGLAVTGEEGPGPPKHGLSGDRGHRPETDSSADSSADTRSFSLKGAPHCTGSIYASETALFFPTALPSPPLMTLPPWSLP